MLPVFDSKDVSKLKRKLALVNNIVIVTHPRPDGDAIGSTLALWHFLKASDKHVTVITPTDFPPFLKWMDGAREIINFEHHPNKIKKTIQECEMIFVLDLNDTNRLEKLTPIVNDSKAFKVMVDHHEQPKDFCDVTFSFPEIASTAELIFYLVKKLHSGYNLTKSFAECIYTGVMTDTGSFRFSNTSGDTHRMVGALLDAGALPDYIHQHIFDIFSYNRMQLLGACLKDKLIVMPDYHTAYMAVSKRDLYRYHYQTGDTEGIVNYGLSIKGIRFCAFMCEHENVIKISFRSKGNFEVNELAKKYFQGGGHKNAAGGRSYDTLRQTVEKFLKVLPEYKKDLTK